MLTQAVIGVAAFGAAFAVYAATSFLGENLHTVVPGKLYRSAQLSTEELDRVIGEMHLQNVVSLRKADPPAHELVIEIQHLDRLGIAHENVPLSPQRLPKPEALIHLIQRFDEGPYPMLVHCEEGVDRTGLAVVIWLAIFDGRSVADARSQELSWRNGHFAFGQAHAMDDFFDLYERTSRGADLRSWIRDTYPHLFETRGQRKPDPVLAHGGG